MAPGMFQLLLCATLAGACLNATAGLIAVESASYGANCGGDPGNSTRELASQCNQVESCRYPVRTPAAFHRENACSADFIAEWSCGPGESHEATISRVGNDGGVLALTCIPSRGAGK